MLKRLYRAALRVYPLRVRQRFGDEMVQVFINSWHAARTEGGRLGVALLLGRTARDIAGNAIVAWINVLRSSPDPSKGPGRQRAHVRNPRTRELAHSVFQDVRFALRTFGRQPMFLIITVATLGVGIGATTTVFSVTDGVLLRPLPYDDPSSLVVLGTTWRRQDGGIDPQIALMSSAALSSTAAPNFFDWRDRTSSFESMAGVMGRNTMVITGEGEPERLSVAHVSSGLFSILGIGPALGRSFVTDDYAVGAPRVALISHALWQRRWGGDPSLIGRTITGGPEPFTIVGIMSRSLHPPEALWLGSPDLWMPESFRGAEFGGRQRRVMRVVARLRPGVTIEAARSELDALGDVLVAEYPDELIWRGTESVIAIRGLHEETVGKVGRTLLVLLGAVGFLLLIACVNVANLFLARGMDRTRELTVRVALGAGRVRIVRQLLTESVLIALLGGTAGVGLAILGVSAFGAFNPGDIPRLNEIAVDWRVLIFALVVSAITGIAFGLAPALWGGRKNATEVLKDGAPSATFGRRGVLLRQALVVGETAMALVLLVGAGLLFNSFVRLRSVDAGFDPTNVLTMRVRLPNDQTVLQRATFFNDLVGRVRLIPGVQSAGAIVNLPIGDVNWRTSVVVDVTGGLEGEGVPVNIHSATPGYFQTMGIRVLRGRDFEDRDDQNSENVVLINESLARQFWPDGNAIGGRLRIPDDDRPWHTVVGIVNDVNQAGLDRELRPELYFPNAQLQMPWAASMAVVAKYQGDPALLAGPLRQAVWVTNANLPIPALMTMEQRVSASIVRPRFYTILFATFATVALALASAGIYGTMLYNVGRRTKEVGIRMALGANASTVLGLVVRQGMLVTLSGIVLGVVLAVLASKALSGFVFGVTTTDATTYAVVSLLLAAVALAACVLPARRATRVDPVAALRAE
jgi:putative ABC transport system permease protein